MREESVSQIDCLALVAWTVPALSFWLNSSAQFSARAKWIFLTKSITDCIFVTFFSSIYLIETESFSQFSLLLSFLVTSSDPASHQVGSSAVACGQSQVPSLIFRHRSAHSRSLRFATKSALSIRGVYVDVFTLRAVALTHAHT